MKLRVQEIDNNYITGYKDKIFKSWEVEGGTFEECFKKVYPSERSLRYCSGCCIYFADEVVHKQYLDWKQHGLTIEMYYGNSTID